MPDPLTDQLMNRQMQDPQAAWQKASTIGADPRAEAANNPANWKQGVMPFLPGINAGAIRQLLKDMNIPEAAPAVMGQAKRLWVAPKLSDALKNTITNDVSMDELLKKFGGWGKP